MGNNKDMPLETLIETLDENIAKLRERLQSEAPKVLPEIPPIGKVVTGQIFIE